MTATTWLRILTKNARKSELLSMTVAQQRRRGLHSATASAFGIHRTGTSAEGTYGSTTSALFLACMAALAVTEWNGILDNESSISSSLSSSSSLSQEKQEQHQKEEGQAATRNTEYCGGSALSNSGRHETVPASFRQTATTTTTPRLVPPNSTYNNILLLSAMQPTISSCEEQAVTPRNKTPHNSNNHSTTSALLQRYRTIRRMDLHSTKDQPLEARYRWNINDILGEGAFGAVYKAYDRETQEPVALKKISKIHTDNEGFQREMRALLHIRDQGGHPHVCALRENFDDPDHYYLILDYIGGGEMFESLINNGAYSERDAARLVREVADALSFLHGIGVVHADLKPENILLSTTRRGDSVVKLADFGCSQVLAVDDVQIPTEVAPELFTNGNSSSSNSSSSKKANNPRKRRTEQPKPSFETPTPAYCPPELMNKEQPMSPPMDMWGLGVILYIMLTGAHPFDLEGDTKDSVIEDRIMDNTHPLPIRDSYFTSHLSESAVDLIEKLMTRDPAKRLTAMEMLEHPWVRGETATTDIIADSDQKLSKFRVFKSKLQAKFFQDIVNWSDVGGEEHRKQSLIERSYHSLETDQQGYLTTKNLAGLTSTTASSSSSSSSSPSSSTASTTTDDVNTDESGGPALSMSDFQDLLAENMRNRYFPAGKVIYEENDIGNHMYFINSGTVEVSTKDGSRAVRGQGDFFGEGALLHPTKTRSATVQCRTPVNAMEISREYFEKYLANSEQGLYLTLREKDKIRKKNRARTVLRLQENLISKHYQPGEAFFQSGDPGDSMFLLDSGTVNVEADRKQVFSVMPGNVFGENSLMTGRRRNVSAVCVSPEGCDASELLGDDFRKLIKKSPNVAESLHELRLRREFKKAVVMRLRHEFPYQNPKEAFDAADVKQLGLLDLESIGRLMRDMNPNYTDEEIEEITRALNLTNSGTVSFDEFKKVFIGDIRTSASI
jgi:serine/threonine protein kinase